MSPPTRNCPVCGAEAVNLYRMEGTTELPVCEMCSDARMAAFENLQGQLNVTMDALESRRLRKLGRVFFSGGES